MIARRDALGGIVALVSPGLMPSLARAVTGLVVLPVPPNGRLGFDVFFGTRKLGTHDLVFHQQSDGLRVDVAVDIAFKVGPMTLYRYTHSAHEHWIDGQLNTLSTQTSDNGKRHRVEAKRDPSGLVVQPDGLASYIAPTDALPASHWNRRELDGPWINTQSGELIRPHVSPDGAAMVTTADNRALHVRRYAISGPVQIVLWYDDAQVWAGLSFTKTGAEIRYARQS